MSIEALKEQARKHEQNEDWGEALTVYVDAINRQSDNDQPDLGLYNRAGDLSTRIGDAVGAIQYYEQAVELYLEAELPNNAIAILKKILRNLPQRSEVFLRMGQIRANQGFLTDARNNFLTYAERKQQDGDMDEAFRALEEFADVAPGDVEVRLALGEQLHVHERTPEALQQLSLAYHQYSARGESEAAQGIETRIHEIDSAFVIPAAEEIAGHSFETNVLGEEDSFGAEFEVDAPVDAGFDEIAFDGDDDISFDSDEVASDGTEALEVGDSDVSELEDPEALAFEAAEELDLDSTEALEFDAPEASEFDTSAEAEESDASFAEVVSADSAFVDDDDDVFGFGDEDAELDFGAAVFGDASPDAEEDVAPAAFGDSSEMADDDASLAMVSPAGDEAALEDQDDWEIGTDIEDAFISFDAPDAEDDSAVGASADVAELATDGELETSDPDRLALVAFDDDEIDDEMEAPAAAFAADDDTEASDALEATDEFSSVDHAVESHQEGPAELEAASHESETAVALEEELDKDDAEDRTWEEAAAASDDDLWSEVAEPAAELDEVEIEHVEAEPEAVEAVELEDEWIGLDADSDVDESDIAADARDASASTDEFEEADAVEDSFAPSLADFEDFSLSDLREYVREHQAVGPAWERIGRVSLEEGNAGDSQEAFEEAHIAYAQAHDFMSAMRCVRELLLGEPDEMVYHQRLVEYAGHADDRTLLVSAYLELADCLSRTGAPAKARAVRNKVLSIDPTNRRAAAAISIEGGAPDAPVDTAEPETDAGYVDLGSMVIDRGEKTTRWTIASEEPVGEADFDFQNMLAQFKAKVAENVDVGDARAHYDLGTAYKEMGLVDEALSEFQAALRADGQNLATYEMLGQCFMDKGQPEFAVRSLQRATEMPFDVEDELLGIYYYLGRAHEELGNSEESIEYYEKIFALDINFEDVTERLRALR